MFSRNVLKYFSTIGFDCLHSLCLYLLFLSCLNLNLKRFKLNLSFACRSKQCRICWSWRKQTVWVGECWGWENLSTKISLQFAMQCFAYLSPLNVIASDLFLQVSVSDMKFKWTIKQRHIGLCSIHLQLICLWSCLYILPSLTLSLSSMSSSSSLNLERLWSESRRLS